MTDGPEIELEAPAPRRPGLLRAARAALAAAGVGEGHLAIALVEAHDIARLNHEHRGKEEPTDVLSFPVDGPGPTAGPRELGDIVICPEHTADLEEAVVHGVLHLCGHDHETDAGEMLALQSRVLAELARSSADHRGAPPAGGGGGPPPRGGWAAADRTRRPRPPGQSRDATTRAGFVALAGRPNVGKSTLLNRIVGTKVAIVSPRPQTTRRAIRGIATGEDWQLVLVDLPGSQRPRDALTERMQRRTERELRDSDAALVLLNGEQAVGPGDRFIAAAVTAAGIPCVVAVNKVDALDHPRTVAALSAAAELELPPEAEIFPISARTGAGVQPLLEALVGLVPEGPYLYPPEEPTDLPAEVRLAELVREQVLARTREELPHAVEVEIDEIEDRPAGTLVVHAHLWAESESQKSILVGRGGGMVRAIGTAARGEIETLTGRRVHLDLTVRVRRDWRRDEALLDRLGIE